MFTLRKKNKTLKGKLVSKTKYKNSKCTFNFESFNQVIVKFDEMCNSAVTRTDLILA